MLSTYSAQALVALQQLLPDLAALAVEKEEYFVIETASPSGWPFSLFSDEEEITVGFAEYHTHFGWHEGDPGQDVMNAVEFIQQLWSGQLELAVYYQGEQYAGLATTMATPAAPTGNKALDQLISALLTSARRSPPPGCKISPTPLYAG
jgi:hypothetical protein